MANLAHNVRRAQRLFADHYPIIWETICSRRWDDEKRQNALAWTWQHLLDGMDVATAVHKACMRRVTYGRPPRHASQADTLDHCEPIGRHDPPENRDDTPTIHWRIAEMPPRLQLVALPLANGLNRKQTAELIGYSTEWIRQRCDEIAAWIVLHQTAGVWRTEGYFWLKPEAA